MFEMRHLEAGRMRGGGVALNINGREESLARLLVLVRLLSGRQCCRVAEEIA
jgi:hypothetical protein